MISTVTFYLSFAVLALKTVCDIRYNHILYKPNRKYTYGLSFISLICLLSSMLLLGYEGYDNYFLKYILIFSLFIEILKYRYKLFLSIEEIYSFFLIAGLAFVFLNPLSSLLLFSIVLASSISAGISKMRSSLWSGRSLFGFNMFTTLPSISRKAIVGLSSHVANTYLGQRVFKLITFSTPFLQIFSAVGLLAFPPDSIIFTSSLCIQLVFTLLLFIISDLSWITSLYALLVISYGEIRSQFAFDQLVNTSLLYKLTILFVFIYTLLCWIKIFYPNILCPLISRNIFFGLGPFKMFTEAHMTNIITYYHTTSHSSTKMINPFGANGHRSSNQNFNSRHLQALMYPVGDLVQLLFKQNREINLGSKIKLSEVATKKLHMMQLKNIASSILDETVSIYQHHFNYETASYVTKQIAKIKFTKELDLYWIDFIFLDQPLSFEGR